MSLIRLPAIRRHRRELPASLTGDLGQHVRVDAAADEPADDRHCATQLRDDARAEASEQTEGDRLVEHHERRRREPFERDSREFAAGREDPAFSRSSLSAPARVSRTADRISGWSMS